jgi:hypothetical protein
VALHLSFTEIGYEEVMMGALVFVCPTSGHEVSTGLEIDIESYRALPEVLADIKCPHCGLTHNLYQIEHRLIVDDGMLPHR